MYSDVKLDGGVSITGSGKDFPPRHDLQTGFGPTYPVIQCVPLAVFHTYPRVEETCLTCVQETSYPKLYNAAVGFRVSYMTFLCFCQVNTR
jgi:hypothetical protein